MPKENKKKKRGIFAADRYYIWSICSGFWRLDFFWGGGAFYCLLWGSFVGILVVGWGVLVVFGFVCLWVGLGLFVCWGFCLFGVCFNFQHQKSKHSVC